jgi:phosphoenolpyruvate synthase/pyruvate phosphate dikinase
MKKYLIIILAFTVYACDFSKRIDTTAAVKEMRERQVKRVLPQDIVNQVDVWGQELQANLAKGQVADTLRSKNKVSIQSGSIETLKKSVKDSKINEMLDAIAFGLSQKQDIPASIQKNSSGDSLYYIYPTNDGNVTLIGFSKKQVIIQMDKPLIK